MRSALTLDLLHGTTLPGFRGAAFRRQAKQLAGARSLWDLAMRQRPRAGAELAQSWMTELMQGYWQLPNDMER